MELKPSQSIRPFPKFTLPKLEGFFSVDSERNYDESPKNLKYLKIPERVKFNLNLGDDDYVDKPPSADMEQITHLLTFLMNNQMTRFDNSDFVCFRGLLKVIMNTPYEKDPWIVMATKFKGTIYLCAEETQLKKVEKLKRTDRDKKFMRYGFKFESYILSDDPSRSPPGNRKPVVESEEFCVMFSSEVGGKKILYGAETDGVISTQKCETLEDLRRSSLVEVKVKRRESNERQLQNFYRFKARNWWLQSFIVGINTIHVGVRNDEGIVDEVTAVPIKVLSDEAKKNNFWHGTVCMNFLNDFLNKVSKEMKLIDDPKVVFRYRWDPAWSDVVTVQRSEEHRDTFLTPEFISFVESRND